MRFTTGQAEGRRLEPVREAAVLRDKVRVLLAARAAAVVVPDEMQQPVRRLEERRFLESLGRARLQRSGAIGVSNAQPREDRH